MICLSLRTAANTINLQQTPMLETSVKKAGNRHLKGSVLNQLLSTATLIIHKHQQALHEHVVFVFSK